MTNPLSVVPGWERFKNLVAKFWWAGLIILIVVLLAVGGGFWWKFVANDSLKSISRVNPGSLHEICREPNKGGIHLHDEDHETESLKDPDEEDQPPGGAPGDIPLQEIVVEPSNQPEIPSIALHPPTPQEGRAHRPNPVDPKYLSPIMPRKSRSRAKRSDSGSSRGSSGGSRRGSSSTPIARTPSALRRTIEKGGSPTTSDKRPAIYRGRSANITDLPFVVALGAHRWPDNWIHPLAPTGRRRQPHTLCTGIIIAPTWVITAGHCVKHFTSRNYVTGGTECRPEFGGIRDPRVKRVKVSRVERHFIKGLTISYKRWLPKWESIGPKPVDRKYQPTDVALLKLAEPIYEEGSQNPSIGPIQLEPIQGLDLSGVNQIKIAGWGATRYSLQVERLKEYTIQGSPQEAILLNPERESDKRHFDWLTPYWNTQCLNASPLVCVKTAPDESQTSHGDSDGPLIAIQNGQKTLLGTVTGGGAIFPVSEEDPEERRTRRKMGKKPEDDEPLLIPVPSHARGMRPGVGDNDVVVFVRSKDKRAWIHGVINGIPFGKRLWNVMCLIGRCLWYCLIAWWLDFLETVYIVIQMVMRED